MALFSVHRLTHEALRLGIVGEVFPADRLPPRVRELAGILPVMLLHIRALLARQIRCRLRDEL